jgi:hypothetical protein
MALAFAGFVMAGAAAQIALWRRQPDTATTLATAIVILGVLLGFWQVKLMPYASWLAVLPLAVFCARLRGKASLSAPLMRVGAVVLLSQATLDAAFATISPLWETKSAAAAVQADVRQPCYRSAGLDRLSGLPAGLIAADIDLGPYIVAHSRHRVVAAPYHRLDKGILANHAIFDSAPEEALREIKGLGVAYVALCRPREGASSDKAGSLRAQLLSGTAVPYLRELDPNPDAPLRVWRVVPR